MEKIKDLGFPNIWFLLFFPLAILGSAALNIYLVITSLFIIYHIYKTKIFLKIIDNLWAKLFILFYIFILVNSFFAIDVFSSIKSSGSQIRFFLFSIFLMYFLKIDKLPIILRILSVLNILVCFDTIFQHFNGTDIFGLTADPINNPNRLSGPFGKELIVGSFLYQSSLIIFSYYIFSDTKVKYEKIYRIFYCVLIISTIVLSGERMNSILIILTTFMMIFLKFKKLQKVYAITFFLSFIAIFYSFSDVAKIRLNDFKREVSQVHHSNHGKIFSSAYDIWKKNFLSGVGLQNFRIACDQEVVNSVTGKKNLCSTHPHNFYFEFLSETGLIGLLLFLSFVISILWKSLKKIILTKEPIMIGCFIILFFYIFPVRSSGSFFSTWYASFFWLHLGVLLCYLNNFKKYNA